MTPPTAAYQLERSVRFVRDRLELMPPLRIALDLESMFTFYDEMAGTLYRKAKTKH